MASLSIVMCSVGIGDDSFPRCLGRGEWCLYSPTKVLSETKGAYGNCLWGLWEVSHVCVAPRPVWRSSSGKWCGKCGGTDERVRKKGLLWSLPTHSSRNFMPLFILGNGWIFSFGSAESSQKGARPLTNSRFVWCSYRPFFGRNGCLFGG